MEIRNLIAFLKVTELRHFTKAAKALGYTQPTITARIQQLEEEIGVPLFERINKNVILTPAGEQLAAYARQILGLCDEVKELGREDISLTGSVKIGSLESLHFSYLQDFIPIFKKRFPRVSLSVFISSGVELMELVRKNELDTVFVVDEYSIAPPFMQVFSKPTDVVFTASTQNPISQAKTLSLAEVLRQPLVLTSKQSQYRLPLAKMVEERNLQLISSVDINNTSAIIQFLKSGVGASYLPRYCIQRDLDNNDLAILNVHDFEVRISWIQLVYHKEKWIHRPMQAFFEMLKTYCANCKATA